MTDIPKTPMGAERANYAAEPPTDFDHARDKLQALADVMQGQIGDVIEKWGWSMIHGIPEERLDYYDGGPLLDPRMAETYARRARSTSERERSTSERDQTLPTA